ncbi:MAG: 6,7-dimethyl-8-ribityllumazine synthase [Candidatus Peribacteraceae bacterium]|nr:6,7-dimethyl-8-ribityllumazine synthase [Candidatus Peribacteraceae bacterium]
MTTPARVAIVAADYNKAIVDPMIAEAEKVAAEFGATTTVTRIPGCYEMPIICNALLESGQVDVIVAIGYIERGHTMHGEVMGNVVHDALVRLQLQYRCPVGIGIIGPGATLEQAQERNVPYARAAVEAALKIRNIIAAL